MDGTLAVGSSQTLTGAGTVSGIVSLSGTIAPGDEGVGSLATGAQTWNGGGAYEWEMSDATEAAETGFDRLSITGNLDVQAMEESKFTIKVQTPGADALNFDNDSAADWPLASVSGSVQNYAADKFTVEYADFSNDLAGGTFEMHASELKAKFVPNQAPTASDPTMLRGFGNPGQIAIEELGNDPDGDGLALVSFSANTVEGATVSTDGTFLIYAPGPNGDVADEISYTIRDARIYRDGDTVRTASGTVSVFVGAAPPVITQQPTNQTLLYGSTAIFNVAASGTGTLLYQWRKGGEDIEDEGNISGATTEALTVASLTFPDNGDYRVVVTDDIGSVTSLVAVLTVLDPYITSDPASVTTNAGATVTFTVSAIGSGTLEYQWTKDGEELSSGGNVSGATSDTLTLSNVSQTDAANYAAIVSNGNSATSQGATLIVIDPPSLDGPFNRMSEVGATATFTVEASGIGPFTYQWKKGDDVLSEYEKYSGVTGSALGIADVTADDAGTYTVFVSNAGGTNSGSATLTVLPAGNRIWSGNGVTKGGAGTWDTSLARWGPSPDGPFHLAWANSSSNSAVFVGDGATPGAVTIGSAVTVNRISITNSTATGNLYTFPGASTLTLSGPDQEVAVGGGNNTSATNTVVVTAPLAGSVLTKTGGGRLSMNSTGNSVGRWIVNGGAIVGSANNSSAAEGVFGTGIPSEPSTNFITLDGGGLGFSGASHGNFSLGPNRGIYLGPGGGQLGSASGSALITIDGPITGPGDLHFPGTTEWPGGGVGANSAFIISNTGNDYEGQTRIATCEILLGDDQVFPATTTLNMVSQTLNGRVNLNGFHQTVAKVIIDTGGNSRVIDTVGGGTLSADEFDLRGSAHSPGTSATLAGAGFLRKTTTRSIILSGTNTYSGNTLIEEGTLTVIGAGSFSNSPIISISSGATLNVTGRDDGTLHLGSLQSLHGSGAVSGNVSVSGTVVPGTSIGTLTTGSQTWNGGGVLEWEVDTLPPGTAGTDWDHLNITGNLDVQASSMNRFTVKVLPTGALDDFDEDETYTWPIATVSGSVQNFSADKFNVDYSEVAEDLFGGEFVVEEGLVNVKFVPNRSPIANVVNLSRPQGSTVKIKIADLLASHTDDDDGDPRALVNVGVDTGPTQGSVSVSGGYIVYTPTDLNSTEADSFTYRVRDVRAAYRAGDTVREAAANINLTVLPVVGQAQAITVESENVTVKFSAIPGYRFDVERAEDVDFTENLTVLTTTNAPANGQFSVTDNDPPEPTAFYRLKYNPE